MNNLPWLMAGVLSVASTSSFLAVTSSCGPALITVQFPCPLMKWIFPSPATRETLRLARKSRPCHATIGEEAFRVVNGFARD